MEIDEADVVAGAIAFACIVVVSSAQWILNFEKWDSITSIRTHRAHTHMPPPRADFFFFRIKLEQYTSNCCNMFDWVLCVAHSTKALQQSSAVFHWDGSSFRLFAVSLLLYIAMTRRQPNTTIPVRQKSECQLFDRRLFVIYSTAILHASSSSILNIYWKKKTRWNFIILRPTTENSECRAFYLILF